MPASPVRAPRMSPGRTLSLRPAPIHRVLMAGSSGPPPWGLRWSSCSQPRGDFFTSPPACALHGDIGLEVENRDLADLGPGDAGVAGEGAEDVAGADFVFAPGTNTQGAHGRQQWATALGLEIVQLVPAQRRLLQLLDRLGAVGFGRRHQADGDAFFTRASGTTDAANVTLRVTGQFDVDHHVQRIDEIGRAHV